jgi:hypothetical protein
MNDLGFMVLPSLSRFLTPKSHFQIMTADEQMQSGTITRQWNSDLSCYTMNIYFADPGMDSKIKSLFLGLGFLLEYLYFQSRSCC